MPQTADLHSQHKTTEHHFIRPDHSQATLHASTFCVAAQILCVFAHSPLLDYVETKKKNQCLSEYYTTMCTPSRRLHTKPHRHKTQLKLNAYAHLYIGTCRDKTTQIVEHILFFHLFYRLLKKTHLSECLVEFKSVLMGKVVFLFNLLITTGL